MWNFGPGLLEIALRAAIIYIVVLIGLRLTGKREVGQMTPFDLVLLLLISNAVQNAMTGPDTSVTGGLVAAATLLIVNALMTRLVWKNRRLSRLVAGSPTLLIYHGEIVKKNLDHEHVTGEELNQVLREHGVATIADVYLATLEVDGTISVLKNDERPSSFQPHHRIRLMKRKA
jgi:uncharacterized membrane protein YcaP (DUF421 family)